MGLPRCVWICFSVGKKEVEVLRDFPISIEIKLNFKLASVARRHCRFVRRKPKKSGRMWVDMGVALGWPHLFVTAQEGNKANEKCVME